MVNFVSEGYRIQFVPIILIALLSITALFFTQKEITEQVIFTKTINQAGLQRMLSQKLSLYASLYVYSKAEKSKRTHYYQAKKTIDNMLQRHQLISTSENLNILNKKDYQLIKDIYGNPKKGIHIRLKKLHHDLDLLSLKNINTFIQFNNTQLLPLLDQVVTIYEKNAEEKLLFTKNLEIILMTLIFLTLIFIVLSILSPLHKKIRQQQQEISSNDELKDNIITIFSHELKTPLTSIRGAISNMNQIAHSQDENFEKMHQMAQQNCKRLLNIIDDILIINRIYIKKRNIAMDELNLKDLLIRITQEHHKALKQKNIQLDLEFNKDIVLIYGNEDCLFRAISNIFSNAIKFSNQDGKIKIAVRSDKVGTHIGIYDHGIGMTPEVKRTVFKLFSALDSSSTRKHDGLGLGLSLAKIVFEKHEAILSIKSKKGQGTAILIHFKNS